MLITTLGFPSNEKDLREHFDLYQQQLRQLYDQYKIGPQDDEPIRYVTEPVLKFEARTS